jgi:hypothetical protein
MDRTQAENHVVVDDKRMYQNRQGSKPGTTLDEQDRNAIQEEIVGFIERRGLIPNASDLNQLEQAVFSAIATAAVPKFIQPQDVAVSTGSWKTVNISTMIPAGATPSVVLLVPFVYTADVESSFIFRAKSGRPEQKQISMVANGDGDIVGVRSLSMIELNGTSFQYRAEGPNLELQVVGYI